MKWLRARVPGGLRSAWSALGLLGLSCLVASVAAAQPDLEARVKAAFLYNFARFVTWPEDSFTGGEFRVGVLGEDPLDHILEETLADKSVNGHPVVVKRGQTWEILETCHILYVPGDGTEHGDLRVKLEGKPVLVVGDSVVFAEQTGGIGFFLEDNRMRFAVNEQSLRRAGLGISSKILRIARIVEMGR